MEATAYTQAVESNTIEHYRAYLIAYSEGTNRESVTVLLEKLLADRHAFEATQRAHTMAACESYLESFLDGHFVLEVHRIMSDLERVERAESAYRVVTELDRLAAYYTYIVEFPDGPRRWDAELRIRALERENEAFVIATEIRTVDSFDYFLMLYPNGQHAKNAIHARLEAERRRSDDLAYDHAKSVDTIDAYSTYLIAYPHGRHVEAAKAAISVLSKVTAILNSEVR